MSTSSFQDASTPTATTTATTWRQANRLPLTLLPCWTVRTRALVLAAQAIVLASTAAWVAFVDPTARGVFLLLSLLGFQSCLYLNRAHESLRDSDPRRFAIACGISLLLGTVVLIAAAAVMPGLRFAAPAAFALGVLSVLSLASIRWLLPRIVRNHWLSEGHLILGANEAARKLREELTAAGAVPFAKRAVAAKPVEASVSLGYGNLRKWVVHHRFSRIVLAETPAGDPAELAAAIVECLASGVRVEQAVDSYERLTGKLSLEGLRPEWLIHGGAFRVSPAFLFVKRAIDAAAAA